MRVSRLRDPAPVRSIPTGMLAWGLANETGHRASACKAIQIAQLGQNADRGKCIDSEEATYTMYGVLILLRIGKFVDSCVVPFDVLRQLFQPEEILVQDLTGDLRQFNLFHPGHVGVCPLCPGVGKPIQQQE